ncbi:MAG: hypothetical protein HGA65_20440, partial [Oscillochloris sp.]|nr:hypothetical protein [Oscillochloris sp.]
TIVVSAGETTVQHLFFTSPAPPLAPTATPEPVVLPAALPDTGVSAGSGAGLLWPLGGLLLLIGFATRCRIR